MRLVTLTTDFGHSDYYVAALKLRLKQMNLGLDILDVTHDLEPTVFLQAAYTLRAISSQSPVLSLHVVCMRVDTSRWLLVKDDNQYYIFPDNGLISCFHFSDKAQIYCYNQPLFRSTFDEVGVISSGVSYVYGEKSLDDANEWTPTKSYKSYLIPEVITDTEERKITGMVLFTDRYNNAITNIRKGDLPHDINLKSVKIVSNYGQEVQSINDHYKEIKTVERSLTAMDVTGTKGAVFNSLGHLEIYMYNSSHSHGGAATLLGFEPLSEIEIYY